MSTISDRGNTGRLETDSNKDVLLALLDRNIKELHFWRERNWDTMKVAVTGYIAVAGVASFWEDPAPLRLLLVVITALAAGYLFSSFWRYSHQKAIQKQIEAAFASTHFSVQEIVKRPPATAGELVRSFFRGTFFFLLVILSVAIAVGIAIPAAF
jgi:hypothetical protein